MGSRLPMSEEKRDGIALVRVGGKADQVVDDDLDGAAHGKAGDGAETQGFCPDALAGKGRVAMDEHGQDFGLAGFSQAHLLGAGPAHGDRIHGFQVTGIRYQVQTDLSAVRVWNWPVAPT